jgi:hypothetical protein
MGNFEAEGGVIEILSEQRRPKTWACPRDTLYDIYSEYLSCVSQFTGSTERLNMSYCVALVALWVTAFIGARK